MDVVVQGMTVTATVVTGMMMMDVMSMAMLGMVCLAARKLKQRLNVIIIGVESFQGV